MIEGEMILITLPTNICKINLKFKIILKYNRLYFEMHHGALSIETDEKDLKNQHHILKGYS